MKENEALNIALLFLKENGNTEITAENLSALIKKATSEELKIVNYLPKVGFVRLKNIIGDPKANPPIPAIIPVSRTTWWQGVQEGRYPAPVYFGSRSAFWPVEDILALVEKFKNKGRI